MIGILEKSLTERVLLPSENELETTLKRKSAIFSMQKNAIGYTVVILCQNV